MKQASIKVGVIADQTGPLSFMGIANANVAKMGVADINANGGLLGRQLDLIVEDSATIDSVAEAKATKLVQHDDVDVIFGGVFPARSWRLSRDGRQNRIKRRRNRVQHHRSARRRAFPRTALRVGI
jgi:ABC-type branched-subunit amino acid transport system substrate-binding protein